jgi:predicted lipoprotein
MSQSLVLAKRTFALGLVCAALLPTCRKDNPVENVFTGIRPGTPGNNSGGTGSTTGGTGPTGRGGSSSASGGSSGTDAEAGSTNGGSGSGSNGGSAGASGGSTGMAEGGSTNGEAGRGAEAGHAAQGDAGSGAEGGAPQTVPFTKQGLLRSIAECSVKQYEDFLSLAEDLAEEASLARDVPSAEADAAVKAAFLTAMASFQRVELLRFGPAARASEEPNVGRDLRDQIYAWRLGGRCNVDTELLAANYAAPDFAETSLINVRGLGAIEYLSFYPNPDNGCPSYFPMNANGEWAALGDDEVWRRRREYTAAISEGVAARARELIDAWDPASQNFFAALVDAGAGSSAYASQQAALNAVSNALFYVEKEVKDFKLGIPLALSPECPAAHCPEALESQFAGISTQNIAGNLDGFGRLFRGCGEGVQALGFDDWLVAVGAEDLNARMLAALEGVERAVDELEPPLELALVPHTDRVMAVYVALKALTDLLKTEFVSVLDLERPKTTEGDND